MQLEECRRVSLRARLGLAWFPRCVCDALTETKKKKPKNHQSTPEPCARCCVASLGWWLLPYSSRLVPKTCQTPQVFPSSQVGNLDANALNV